MTEISTESQIKEAYSEGCRALERHEFARAVAAFGRALVLNPDDPLNLHGAGIALTKLSRHKEAEALFRRAIESAEAVLGSHNPALAPIAFGLIDLYCLDGRHDEAELVCRRVLRRIKASPAASGRVRLLIRLAGIHRKQGRLNDAERAYLAAIAERTVTFGGNHPKVAEILPHLADLYRDMDRPIDAAETARRVLRIRYPGGHGAGDHRSAGTGRDKPIPAG